MTNGTDLMCSSFLYVLRVLERAKAVRGRMLTGISRLGKVREKFRVNRQRSGFLQGTVEMRGSQETHRKVQVGDWPQLAGNEDLYRVGVGWRFIHMQLHRQRS